MSMRTLVELNHDYTDEILSPEAAAFLRYYLASGSKVRADQLKRFGIRVVGMRHHADRFILDGTPDGFPPMYLERPASADRNPQGEDPKGLRAEHESATAEGRDAQKVSQ